MGRRPKRIDLPADVPSPEPVTRRSRRRGKAETERLKERPISPTETEMEVGEEDTFALPGQQITRLVLETVAQMPPPGVGLRTIAGILRGETRANWLSYIARTENWGALFPNSLASVEALLQDLVRAGYIEGKHFVRLTEKGQRALEDANELPVPRRPLKAVPSSLRPLLWKLLLLRARLVNERKAPGLLKDSVLLQLLQHPPKRLSELKKMKGVGAFIANNLGKEIVRVVREFFQRSEASKKEAPSDGAA
jgi:DNA-binding PadR family transcriptional regulator